MPRKSPYSIVLSLAEETELKRMASKYTSPYYQCPDSALLRLLHRWPNIVVVHLPVHASWLNQIEIYFSIVQRKVLTPNDFDCLEAVEERLFQFQEHYEKIAKPFEWKFTQEDLTKMLKKLSQQS